MADAADTARTPVSPSAIEAGRWILDPAGSTVRVRHKTFWGLATVSGRFTAVNGEGEVLADGSARGSLTIDAASLDTRNPKRDAHLRNADFLDTDHHPEITVAVSGAVPGEGATVAVDGELTVLGRTRPLSFTARLTEATADTATLTADVEIDRTGFGMTWNRLGMMTGAAALTVTARFIRR
ncbi:YceI family protein [Streptomyces botrytidirepellens]|uniref:YceI family protein n=1 Tax=Streptomyces botrytidirepellens TaxID=2486417 RepID=A0A3M8XEC0_9ACTN|nr:YceI family protein [Streptomyces botrytidirepellens]RNG39135.1 YceI family protein [Streptomyces botrytidirepellens]